MQTRRVQLGGIMLWLLTSAGVVGLEAAASGYPAHFQAKATEILSEGVQGRSAAVPSYLVQSETPDSDLRPQEGLSDVPYVPTPNEVVEEMLKLAQVTSNDVIYDLGCGDGRIVITAAQKLGARGVGIDINPRLVQQSRENARKAGVSDRVKFLQKDLFLADFREATVVTLYLLPEVNLRLRPELLKQLKPGTRIVSHNYDMGEWKPDRVVRLRSDGRQHVLYFWIVPEIVPENLLSN